jgi:hypothetical protein
MRLGFGLGTFRLCAACRFISRKENVFTDGNHTPIRVRKQIGGGQFSATCWCGGYLVFAHQHSSNAVRMRRENDFEQITNAAPSPTPAICGVPASNFSDAFLQMVLNRTALKLFYNSPKSFCHLFS